MALDSNGIWSYEETDSEATASDLLNLLADSTSNKVADLQAQVDSKQPLLGDTGWIDATLSNNFVAYGPGLQVRYRRVGKSVEIEGESKPANTTVAGNLTSVTQQTIFTLPAGFRPSRKRPFVCQGSGRERWTFQVNPDGTCTAARWGTTGRADVAAVDTWLPVSVNFLLG